MALQSLIFLRASVQFFSLLCTKSQIDRSAGGRAGDGQSRTGVRRGSGANQNPAVGRRELGAVAFTAGICVRVVAVVLL